MKLINWDGVDWRRVEFRVSRLQNRIYSASLKGDSGLVLFLQRILIKSLDSKLLAVRRVTTENKGKNTPGVDLRTYVSSREKAQLVSSLKVDGRFAPIRRILIPKPGRTEKRPLGIPVIRDRAKQALVLMALEPQWESRFEPNSYGFRPGRSPHDAVEAVFLSIKVSDHSSREKFVVDADLKGCFDNIDHQYLISKLDTLPIIRNQVKAWLRAGFFEGLHLPSNLYGEVPENPLGTPQGGVISPFLCNVALHGMEQHLKDWIIHQDWPYSQRHQSFTTNKVKSISLIRFADDFVIIHSDKGIALAAKDELSLWLKATSNLSFNEAKTSVRSSREGFNFLGFSFITIKRSNSYRTKIYPSKENFKQLIKKVGDSCRRYRSISSYDLIGVLRPIILGWANYFRYCECKYTFSVASRIIFQILRSWAFRRDRRHGRFSVKEKYFPSGKSYTYEGRAYSDNWILFGQKRSKGGLVEERFLPRISWVSSLKYVKVRGNSSVYDGHHFYWVQRLSKYSRFDRRTRKLLKIQAGRCPLCNGYFGHSSVIEVDHIIPLSKGGKDVYSNLQLVHRHCHILKTKQDLIG
uniref:Reverse transcriptase domain-containing protein n=1 Tax=Caulerpa manorensis TaxID=717648 RepID=A0A2P0QI82_9CHLO|nr:hypothetical protein [Caulerpa manorensis]ARO74453.1 hypothetical protein [Caulerpa manorensis]